MTNAYYGLHITYDSSRPTIKSDRLTVSNSEIYGMGFSAMYVLIAADSLTVTGNRIHDNIFRGLDINGVTNATVSNNKAYNHPNQGIYISGGFGVVSGNEVFANGTGIQADDLTVSANIAHDNTDTGIWGGSRSLLLNNIAYKNTTGSGYGIRTSGGVARSNVSYANKYGIYAESGGTTIDSNRTYSNSIAGIYATFSGGGLHTIWNNLVYANANFGIQLNSAANSLISSNTVYQPTGDAVRLQASSTGVTLKGNILWVEAGADIYVATDSQAGLVSDYNVFHKGAGAAANVGFWNNAPQSTLANWQAASGKDAASVAANPQFIDIDGADNVLGYSAAGAGANGGDDDNFHLSKTSPAIDRGESWQRPRLDATGGSRVDEASTPNAGPLDYKAAAVTSQFSATGTARNFKVNGPTYFQYTLPFSFNFYGAPQTVAYIGSGGLIEFGSQTFLFDGANSAAKLATRRAIAPLWDNLRTNGATDDIFIDTSIPDQVKIRWNATHIDTGADVNFAVVLFADGRIRFDYGPGNTALSATIGISLGNGQAYLLSPGDSQATLTNANSVEFSLAPGFADAGALEFRGSVTDVAGPTIGGSSPGSIFTGNGGQTPTVNHIDLTLSEPLNPTDARAPANYQLRYAGADGILGNGDDVLIPVNPQYNTDSNQLSLQLANYLAGGLYQLTLFGSAGPSLRDLSGNRIDGDANGTPGGDFVRTFTVIPPPAITTITQTSTTSPRTISLKFNKDVSSSLSASDLILTGATGVLPSNFVTYSWNPATLTATWIVTGPPGGVLPDGNYLATLNPDAVTDAAGNLLDANYDGAPGDALSLSFSHLACDFNRDGVVNNLDFNILRSNYNPNQTGKIQPQGDANYDGRVDFKDFQKLELAFNQKISDFPPAAPPPAAAPEVLAPATFSAKPIRPQVRPVPQPAKPAPILIAKKPQPKTKRSLFADKPL
jgi:hypothetical protein